MNPIYRCRAGTLHIKRNRPRAGQTVAKIIAGEIRNNPRAVIGLTPDRTLLPAFRELVRMYREENLDFSEVTAFCMDVDSASPSSSADLRSHLLWKHLFRLVNINPALVHHADPAQGYLLNVRPGFDRHVAEMGGFDLAVLDIRSARDLPFADAARQPVALRGRRLSLIPASGRCMMLSAETLLQSRTCLMMASGAASAPDVAAAVEGPLCSGIPSMILKQHLDAILVIDENAAAELKLKTYYQWIQSGCAFYDMHSAVLDEIQSHEKKKRMSLEKKGLKITSWIIGLLLSVNGFCAEPPLALYEFHRGSPSAVSTGPVKASEAAWSGVSGGGFSSSQGNAYVTTDETKGSFDSSRYLTVTVAAEEGYVLYPESFSFALGGSRSTPGAPFAVQAALRTDACLPALELQPGWVCEASHTFQDTQPTFTVYTADLNGDLYQGRKSLTFRIYVRTQSGSRSINLRLDSLRLNGTAAPGTPRSRSAIQDPDKEALNALLNDQQPRFALASLFADGAVLQRDRLLSVWGSAQPGAPVSVQFAGQTTTTTADELGRWETFLSPLEAHITGRDLIVTSRDRKIVRSNVVVGEVWLCAGQSNMAWPLRADPRAEQVVSQADFPLIRHFKTANRTMEKPADQVEGSWEPCTPETAGSFTALGYYFARDLYRKLNVPIGLINSTWGGTSIAAWMSPSALKAFPHVTERWSGILADLPRRTAEYEKERAEFQRRAAEARETGAEFNWRRYPRPPPGPGTREAPSGIFNGMIAPLIPYSMAGILWYQGEGDSGNAARYAEMFPALIEDWRKRWDAQDMPFYFVQLPNYEWTYDRSGMKWAEFRAAQMQALSLPSTGAAIIIDGATPDDGHPPDKTDVGLRLARLAAVRYYQIESGDACGPLLQSAVRNGNTVVLRFTEASSGLKAVGNSLAGFELAGPDGLFTEARAVLEKDTVLVLASTLPEPVAVRYAWRNNPPASLRNGEGLPASPFSVEVE